jgi:hypothetical protein
LTCAAGKYDYGLEKPTRMGYAHPEDAATFKDQLKIPPKRQAKGGRRKMVKEVNQRSHAPKM